MHIRRKIINGKNKHQMQNSAAEIINWYSYYRKEYAGSSKRLKTELPHNPAIPHQYIYPKEMKSLSGRDVCTSMFIAALFTVAKTWKQPKCPSTNERIKKQFGTYVYNETLCSHKNKEILPPVTDNMYHTKRYYLKWNKLFTERQILHHLTYTQNLKISQTHKTEEENWQGWGWGNGGISVKGIYFQLWVSSKERRYSMVTIANKNDYLNFSELILSVLIIKKGRRQMK